MYFEYKVLDKIHWQPTVNKLLMLFRQLKRNSQWITCALGGEQLENLGLIISPEAYEKISQTETFVCTKNKTDDPTVTFTAADIVQQKVTHDKLLRSYIECQVLE